MSDQILVSIYVRRDRHENGMTLQEYSEGVSAGSLPILDHDAFVYQFGAVEDEINLVVNSLIPGSPIDISAPQTVVIG